MLRKLSHQSVDLRSGKGWMKISQELTPYLTSFWKRLSQLCNEFVFCFLWDYRDYNMEASKILACCADEGTCPGCEPRVNGQLNLYVEDLDLAQFSDSVALVRVDITTAPNNLAWQVPEYACRASWLRRSSSSVFCKSGCMTLVRGLSSSQVSHRQRRLWQVAAPLCRSRSTHTWYIQVV